MTNNEQPSISITLSPAQVDEVVRAASQGRAPSVSTLIANSLSAPLQAKNGAKKAPVDDESLESQGMPVLGGYLPSDTADPRLSRSLLRGLSILTCFGPDGGARGIVDLAGDLRMSPSTAHRYASTLVELGLLERCPRTRKYRLPGIQ